MGKALQAIGLVPKPPKPKDPPRMPIQDEASETERQRRAMRERQTSGRESTRLSEGGDYGGSVRGG